MLAVAGCASRSVTVKPATVLGDTSAYVISDGQLQATIAPDLSGRIVAFGKVGGENILWLNPKLPRRLPHDPKQWHNYGGDKSWIWPQDQWATLFGHGNWPPEPAFDGLPFTSEPIRNGLRLTGPVEPKQSIRLVREITLVAHKDGSRLRVLTRIESTGPTPSTELAAWTVTQLPFPESIEIPDLTAWKYMGGKPWPELEVRGGTLRLPPSKTGATKVGADGSELVFYGGDFTFRQRIVSATRSNVSTRRPAESLQVYRSENTSPDSGDHYIELELTSPLSSVSPDRPIELVVEWSLTSR
jgi:hypothetical protein